MLTSDAQMMTLKQATETLIAYRNNVDWHEMTDHKEIGEAIDIAINLMKGMK